MLGVGCMVLTGLMRLCHGGKLMVRARTGLVAVFKVCVPAGLPAGPGRAALMASCATASQFRNN